MGYMDLKEQKNSKKKRKEIIPKSIKSSLRKWIYLDNREELRKIQARRKI